MCLQIFIESLKKMLQRKLPFVDGAINRFAMAHAFTTIH